MLQLNESCPDCNDDYWGCPRCQPLDKYDYEEDKPSCNCAAIGNDYGCSICDPNGDMISDL